MKNCLVVFRATVLCSFLLPGCYAGRLTPATQTGANTFSCKINGVVYLSQDDFFLKGLSSAIDHYNGSSVFHILSHGPQYKPAKAIDIYLADVDGRKTEYLLNASSESYGELQIIYPRKTYTTKLADHGKVTITKYDPVNHTCSGTFSFIVINRDDSNDRIYITDGRFDVHTTGAFNN